MRELAFSINGQTIAGVGGMPTGGISQTFGTISDFTGLFVLVGVLLALFVLIWGGFSWITSGGDKQKVNQARDKIFYAVVGLVLIFLAYFIVNLLYYFFGINTGAHCIPTPHRPCP